MDYTRRRKRYRTKPIESHETAAWADIANTKPFTNVAIPSESAVRDAKNWVDSNHK